MPEINKAKIEKGRLAVDTYRGAHRQLHLQPWTRDVPNKHTPLLEKMLADLKKQGFNSLDEFFTTSDELNIQELGFKDRVDFEAGITKLNADAERQVLIDEEGNPVEVVIDTPEAKALRQSLEEKWH